MMEKPILIIDTRDGDTIFMNLLIPPGCGRIMGNLTRMRALAFNTEYNTDLEKELMSRLQDALVLINAFRRGEVQEATSG